MPPVEGALLDRARDAISRNAYEDAYAILTDADRDRSLDPDALAMLAEAAYLTAHPDVSVDAWERVLTARLAEGDRAGAAAAAVQITSLMLDSGQHALFRGWARRADELLEGLPESAALGRLEVIKGFEALIHGDIDAALGLALNAEEIGRRVGVPGVVALGRNVQGRALLVQGHVDEGMTLLEETAAMAVSGALDPESTTVVYCSSVCAAQSLADYERAEEWTAAMDRWCERNMVGAFHGWCRVHGAQIKGLRGAWREAEAEAERACEEVRPYTRWEVGWPLTELGQIRLRMGDLARAEASFLEASELGWDPQPGLALLRLAQGDVAAAAESIRDAVDHPSDSPSWERPSHSDLRLLPLLDAQVRIAIAAGDLERAGWAAGELERIAATFGAKALHATAEAARGSVRLAEGDHAGARANFQASVRRWQEIGAPYETARARLGLAEAYRDGGNAERAALEARAARMAFERLGAKPDVRRAADIEGRRRVVRSGEATREEKVFVFTDIVRSTDLVELIGDEAWAHLVRWHNETLNRLVHEHGGDVVRTMGDGFFITFDDPRRAMQCAVAIQGALAEHRRDEGFSPKVRIGLHRAEATREGGDWSGVGVHAAARIGALAEADQILASRETAEAAGAGYEASAPRPVSLKGIAEPVDVVVVAWR